MPPLPRMREVELGWGKVLLVKDNGEFHALGHKCPHYGAPLVKGELSQHTQEVARDPLLGCLVLLGPPGPHLLVGSPGLWGRASSCWDTGERDCHWWSQPSTASPRRAVPGPSALPLAWCLLQHRHRRPGGLPRPGQSAQIPGGARHPVRREPGGAGQGTGTPKPDPEQHCPCR